MKIKGRVVRGRGIGAKLGYPTANIKCSDCPDSGVYFTLVDVGEKSYRAAAVVKNDLIEVLLFNFSGDLYGQELEIKLLKKVSEIEKFDNERDLIEKIKKDIKLCLQE